MLQIHYIAKITENVSVTVLSFCANYIKQAAHLCFGNNVTCYMSAISKSQVNHSGNNSDSGEIVICIHTILINIINADFSPAINPFCYFNIYFNNTCMTIQ